MGTSPTTPWTCSVVCAGGCWSWEHSLALLLDQGIQHHCLSPGVGLLKTSGLVAIVWSLDQGDLAHWEPRATGQMAT